MPSQAQTPQSIPEEQLKELMANMKSACDVVRVVEPSSFQARTLDETGAELIEPYRCYTALCHDRRCENCISMRALEENRSVSKFEFVDGDAYFITARPIIVDGVPNSLEMVQKVSDDIGLHKSLDDLQEHIQEETDREFVDGFTGAYSRYYFEEGLQSLRGRKLAIVKVDNLDDINRSEGYPTGDLMLKRVSHEIQRQTRIDDTVVHYKSNKFVIQFEDMDSELFAPLIDKVFEGASSVTVEGHPHLQPVIHVAAVDEDGTYGDLVQHALELLDDIKANGERVRVVSSDEHHRVSTAVRAAAANETLRHDPTELVANTDELTGLLTSPAIRAHLQHVLEGRPRREDGYCVIYFDIENFKQFNRTYGRSGGDMLLKFLGDAIAGEFPRGKTARTNGDIFITVTSEPNLPDRIDRLRERTASYQDRLALELKAGIFELDEAAKDPSAAIDLAKIACESIKGRYDLGIRFYDSVLDQEVSMNEYVANNIERAIEQGRIKVFFQPVIRAMTGHVCGFEALCRWDDPQHGLLPPSAFIAALERFHLINKLDECVVRQVCQHQEQLMAKGAPIVPVSVNLSRLDFQLDDIFEVVEREVAAAGIPRNMLIIEVTESALDEDSTFFSEQLDQFRDAGYEVWMDDFGSGYSSLNLLKDYRFDTLKIAMEFLASFEDNPKSREIIVTMVDMAKKLGIRTLIEGVETKKHYRFLQRIGCEMLQGFYFCQPRLYDEDAFSEFVLEDASERAYFDELGSVNLLGGLTDEGALAGDVTESEQRSTPMALVEYRDGRYGYLSANEAYLKLLETHHTESFDDVQDVLSSGLLHLWESLQTQLDDTRATERETIRTCDIAGEAHQVHIRHIATSPGAHAYVIIPIPLG